MRSTQPSPGPSLEPLKDKYTRSGLLNLREMTGNNRGYSTVKRTSISRPTTVSRRLSSQNTTVFSNRQSFRDIVLKAAEHKPFLERLNSGSRNRLAEMGHQARLEKFRQIASRWKNKSKGGSGIDTLPEIDYEVEIPEKPRFCATLSTEAQYAIFKGYEDVLVDKISSSLTPNAENTVHIKRIPSAAPKTNSKKPSLPILENQPNIVLISSAKSKDVETDDREPRPREDTTSARLKRVRDQRYMSTHFKQAMNILDEVKRHNSSAETSTALEPEDNIPTVQNNICRQYHAWSKRWAKHFEFCSI